MLTQELIKEYYEHISVLCRYYFVFCCNECFSCCVFISMRVSCRIGLLQWGWGSAGGQDADHLAAHSVRAAHHPCANWLTFSQRSVLQWVSSWKPQIENGMILISSTFCWFSCFIIKTFFSVLSDNHSRYAGSWSLKLLLLFFGGFFNTGFLFYCNISKYLW